MIKRYSYLCLLSALLLSVVNSFSQWVQQQSGTIHALRSVYFLNENTGFTCGYNTVLKTTNGGVNWQDNFLQGSHNNIKFTDNQTGYICSDSGKIFKTADAGANWQTLVSGTTEHLYSMDFLDANTGIAAGNNKTILKTTNAGLNWYNTANFVWEINLLGCKIVDSANYFASGNESFIMRTTNAGLNWVEYTHGEVNPLFVVEFINNNTGWATGCCGMFMATTNGGVNWTYEYYLSLGFTFYTMQFINQHTGYVAGDNGMIFRTTNGGLWWDSTVTDTYQSIYSIHMLNSNTGWVTGGYGTIYKTTNGGGTGYTIGISQISAEVPKKFELYQNYPNPFNPNTKIKFSIPGAGFVELKIYNVIGKEVAQLVSSDLRHGVYEADFDAANLSSGIYFCKLTYSGISYTKKMILIK